MSRFKRKDYEVLAAILAKSSSLTNFENRLIDYLEEDNPEFEVRSSVI